MPSPPTFAKLDVCNQALTGLHEARLTDLAALAGSSKPAQHLREHYDAVVLFCLTLSNWRFATAKRSLNKLSDVPINRWAASWQLPEDCCAIITTWPPSSYELANRQILSNEITRLDVDYLRYMLEGYWPPWFLRLVVAELVMRTCRPITGASPDAEMKDERDRAESKAFFWDAQQQPNQTMQSNDFVDCRN